MRRPLDFSSADFESAVAALPQTDWLRIVHKIRELGRVGSNGEPYIVTEYQVPEFVGQMHMGVMPLVLMVEMANQSLLLLARLIGACGKRDLAEARAVDSFESHRFVRVGEILTCRLTVLRSDEYCHRPMLEALASLTVLRDGSLLKVATGIVCGRHIGSPELLSRLLARDERACRTHTSQT